MNYFKNLEEEQNRLNLKSEKIELGVADDLKSEVNDAQKLLSNVDKAADDYRKLESSLARGHKDLMKVRNDMYNLAYREMQNSIKSFEKQAKDLGINPLDNKDYKQAVSIQKDLFEIVKELDTIKQYKPTL